MPAITWGRTFGLDGMPGLFDLPVDDELDRPDASDAPDAPDAPTPAATGSGGGRPDRHPAGC
jgi:hypothetical protein